MHLRRLLALTILLTTWAFADDSPHRYVDAHSLWEKTRDRAEYQQYLDEFVQYNNDLHLDERDGCYRLAPGSVNLMLVIVHHEGEEFAVVQSAFSDVDTAKARCFKKTYEGLRTKVPPFLPFALQMAMS